MAKQYSDAEKLLAAQIAYLDIGNTGQDLGSVIASIEENYRNNPNDAYLKRLNDTITSIKNVANENKVTGWENWKIVAVCDDNDNSGYYGMLIETGDKEAIITNRGSEPRLDQLSEDWITNDGFFLDGDGTSQENRAQKFMEDIWYRYGQDYDAFTVTGHSLGGHLALHQAITAPTEMQAKINDATSWDGPGFSEEYIRNHRDDIDRMAPNMTHYNYSFVGSLLLPLPGVGRTTIDAENSFIDRHSLSSVKIEGGKVLPGHEVTEATVGRLVTELAEIDGLPSLIVAILGPVAVVPMSAIVLLKTIVNVYRDFLTIKEAVVSFYEDVKYTIFKPRVSGDYEMDILRVNGLVSDMIYYLRNAQNEAEDSLSTILSMNFQWTTCAYLRSKIRSDIISIENDILKLTMLNRIMNKAAIRYDSADKQVVSLFS